MMLTPTCPSPVITATTWPAVFHITHHKAGSQWLHKILASIAPDRVVLPTANQSQVLEAHLASGRLYPTIYLNRSRFDALTLPHDAFVFFMHRDMRDVLVSLYFSNRYSHTTEEFPWIRKIREELNQRSIEDGLHWFISENASGLIEIEYWLEIVRSWLNADVPIIRYEELLDRDEEILTELFLGQAKLPVSRDHLLACIRNNRFEQLTRGRKRGIADHLAHERKGIAGDWKNYFTPRLKKAFLERCGSILIETGHEIDHAW